MIVGVKSAAFLPNRAFELGNKVRGTTRYISPQVVLATQAAIRLPAAGTDFHSAEAELFSKDMPRAVPASRWQSDETQHLHLGNRMPVRFGSFLSGAFDSVT